jgi:hypothetical protein
MMTDDSRCLLGSLSWDILERAAVARDIVVRIADGWVTMRSERNMTSFTVTDRYEFQWMVAGGTQQKFSTADRSAAINHALKMLDDRLR